MEIIIGWVIFSLLVGVYWSTKGRSFAGGFFLSLLLSPLIAFIIGLLISPNVKKMEKKQIQSGSARKCPFCAETVKSEANICRYCGRDLTDTDAISKIPVRLDKRQGFVCPHCNLRLWFDKYKDNQISLEKDNIYKVRCWYCHKDVLLRKE